MQRDYALASADACAHSFPPPRKDIMHKRRWQCVVPCAVHRTVPHHATPRHAIPRRAMPHRITFPRCGIIAARWQMGVVKRFRPLLHESRRSQPILEIATTHSTRDINIFVVILLWLMARFYERFARVRFREQVYLFKRTPKEFSLCARWIPCRILLLLHDIISIFSSARYLISDIRCNGTWDRIPGVLGINKHNCYLACLIQLYCKGNTYTIRESSKRPQYPLLSIVAPTLSHLCDI